jgi:hypothetical protein
MRTGSLYILFIFSCFSSLAQNNPGEVSYEITRAKDEIIIDGILDEVEWANTPKSGGFYQTFPSDNQLAKDSTQFMIKYTDKAIVIGIICYDALPGNYVSTTLRRDFDWSSNDNVAVYLDPYNDKTNGFTFQVTPNNVQREGLILLGGSVKDDWDNKWASQVHQGDGFWSAEISIPFKSIRYNNGSQWNIQILRNNLKRNEQTSWIRVPIGYRPSNMTFTGSMLWDTPPSPVGPSATIIPYVAASIGRNHEEGEATEQTLDAGFDAKVAVSSSLNLDLTFNPDFSQVEVDRQVTNLQRFELSFPERRQFFLENQDLFADGGFGRSRPFFSRRIGIQGSGDTRRNVPIIAGARLSGKIGSKWRIGALDMVTNRDETKDEISPAQNYSVAVLERQIFNRSRLSAIFVGRNNLGKAAAAYDTTALKSDLLQDYSGNPLSAEDTLLTLSEYNYVFGLDYNLATVDNSWEGDFFYHRSADPNVGSDKKYATGIFLRYQKPEYGFRVNFQRVGKNHNAEVGYVPRPGVTNYGIGTEYNFFTSEGSKIQKHGPNLDFGGVLTNNWDRLDNDSGFDYKFSFLNTSYLEVGTSWDYVSLTSSFDPSGSEGGLELPAGTNHSWISHKIFYRSDRRKKFIVRAAARNGGFFNGTRFNAELGLTFRLPPFLQIELNGEYNKINLPSPYQDADLYLIGPRIDLTLSNTVFFTSFIQYNSQSNNLGHNSRFQWRFKPVSDVFLVYTDNYVTDTFQTKNRAIVFKINYWLNL